MFKMKPIIKFAWEDICLINLFQNYNDILEGRLTPPPPPRSHSVHMNTDSENLTFDSN